ncbi:MAG: TetR/AcrR family transcriptional regulator [Bacteroidota bacterium]
MATLKGEKTRQHFIKVSAELFNTKGYAGTSIGDVVKKAGYSKGALFRTFGDKDELAIEAFKYNYGIMLGYLRNAVDHASSDIDKILAILRFYKSIPESGIMDSGCPALNTATEADDNHPILNQLASKAFKEVMGMIERQIKRAQKNGTFNPAVDAQKMARFIFSTIEGSIGIGKSTQIMELMSDNIDMLEKMILQEVRKINSFGSSRSWFQA